MMLMDDSVSTPYEEGVLDPKDALEKVLDRDRFVKLMTKSGGKKSP